MKILFYIEPRIEMSDPYLREFWLSPFTMDIISTLRKCNKASEMEFCIAMNEPLHFKYRDIGEVKTKIFTQKELLPPDTEEGMLALSVHWLNETYSAELMQYYEELMREKFLDFIPDIIITFTPAPFFRRVFPAALMLNHEVSLFSRAPYPQTWYLDPGGTMFGAASFLNRFRDNIKNISLGPAQKEFVRTFKEKYREHFRSAAFFDDIMLPLKERFDHLVFVPLGHSESCSYYSGREFKFITQYEFLQYILDHVPPNIGVLATAHPDFNHILSEEARVFLKEKYPHFIYHETFDKYYAVSMYLLSYVDVVIGIYSSICFQALVHDKKVLNLGTLDIVADSSSLRNIEELCESGAPDKDGILYWIITRYAFQKQYFHDPEWFSRFLVSSLGKFRTTGIDFDFYGPVDSDEKIFGALTGGLQQQMPDIYKKMSYNNLRKSYDELRSKYEELCSRDVYVHMDEVMKKGEEMFSGGRVGEAYDLFMGMLSGTNKFKGDILNNIAVIHAHEGQLDQAERYLNYLISEGYESRDAARNLEMIREMRGTIESEQERS